MRTAKIIRIVCWSLIAMVLLGVLIRSISNGNDRGFGFIDFNLVRGIGRSMQGETLDKETVYEISPDGIENLEIDWISGEVDVIPYEGNVILVTEYHSKDIDDEDKASVNKSGNTLNINFLTGKRIFGNMSFNLRKSLKVQIPHELATNMVEIRIDGVSSEISLLDIDAKDLKLDSVSGKIVARGNFMDIDVDTVSGKVQLDIGSQFEKCDIETVSGDAVLAIPEDTGFTVEQDKVSGSFESEFAMSFSKNRGEHLGGGAKITMDTVSGNLRIEKNN